MEAVVQWATLLSAAVAAVGVYVALLTVKRQANVSVFLEYTKRYEKVMSEDLLRRYRLEEEDKLPESSEELRLALLRYLNLCAEEYCLHETGYLSHGIWGIWCDELERTLRGPLYVREWPHLRSTFDSYPEFQAYVDRIQEPAKAKAA